MKSLYYLHYVLLIVCLILTGCRSSTIIPNTQDLLPPLNEHSDLPAAPFFVYGENVREIFPLFIAEERVAIAGRDIGQLSILWASDAQIIDQRGTESTEDDYIWRGRAAILDRYKVAVFRFSPPLIEPPTDLSLSCGIEDSQQARKNGIPLSSAHQGAANLPLDKLASDKLALSNVLLSKTVRTNDELPCLKGEIADGTVVDARRAGDQWRFNYQQGRWWIGRLVYN